MIYLLSSELPDFLSIFYLKIQSWYNVAFFRRKKYKLLKERHLLLQCSQKILQIWLLRIFFLNTRTVRFSEVCINKNNLFLQLTLLFSVDIFSVGTQWGFVRTHFSMTWPLLSVTCCQWVWTHLQNFWLLIHKRRKLIFNYCNRDFKQLSNIRKAFPWTCNKNS